jgi:hypothetical protein
MTVVINQNTNNRNEEVYKEYIVENLSTYDLEFFVVPFPK